MIVQTVTLNQTVAAVNQAYTSEIFINREHTASEAVFQLQGHAAGTQCSIEGKLHPQATYTTLTPTPTLTAGVDAIVRVPICSQYRVLINNTAELSAAAVMTIYMGN